MPKFYSKFLNLEYNLLNKLVVRLKFFFLFGQISFKNLYYSTRNFPILHAIARKKIKANRYALA
jgi:hypothetical protein